MAIDRYNVNASAASEKTGTPYTKVSTTEPSVTSSTVTGGSSKSATETSKQTFMSSENLAALQALIQALQGGGTNEQRAAAVKRQQALEFVKGLFNTVSTEQALIDAKALMALNLQQSMEKNLPAIQRAIEGAGTSASSMQGVLSQQAARDAALASGALGAQQAQVYAQQRSTLANTLEALTREDSPVTTSLIQALQVAKGSVIDSTKTGTQNSSNFSNTIQQNPSQRIIEQFLPGAQSRDSIGQVGSTTETSPLATGFGNYYSYNTNSYWNPQQVSLAEWLANPAY